MGGDGLCACGHCESEHYRGECLAIVDNGELTICECDGVRLGTEEA